MVEFIDSTTVGITTALPKEFAAVQVLLEDGRELSVAGTGAGRRYWHGYVPAENGGRHPVLLALAGMGNNSAAIRATQLLQHFPQVRDILMVGIAGGVPHLQKPEHHVRLGDIVVSHLKGVVQYDFDKETVHEVTPRFPYRPPGAYLIEAVDFLQVKEKRGQQPWLACIDRAAAELGWQRPDPSRDRLAASNDPAQWLEHPVDPWRVEGKPRVFYGPIASANKLLKNPLRRDLLRDTYGVKAVEMEGSGIADAAWQHQAGYLVIRGVCDYCDENKNDEWQETAAVAAAGYARALLTSLPAQNGGGGQSTALPPDRTEHYRKLLALHRKHLDALEEKIAMYGELEAPVHIVLQRNREVEEVRRLENLLGL